MVERCYSIAMACDFVNGRPGGIDCAGRDALDGGCGVVIDTGNHETNDKQDDADTHHTSLGQARYGRHLLSNWHVSTIHAPFSVSKRAQHMQTKVDTTWHFEQGYP